jgi:hypothetical protein
MLTDWLDVELKLVPGSGLNPPWLELALTMTGGSGGAFVIVQPDDSASANSAQRSAPW